MHEDKKQKAERVLILERSHRFHEARPKKIFVTKKIRFTMTAHLYKYKFLNALLKNKPKKKFLSNSYI